MLLQYALMLMTLLMALFVLAWLLSPKLRETLEEPKFKILEESKFNRRSEMQVLSEENHK
jgi:hypothetical protein